MRELRFARVGMRTTWDALARGDTGLYVGDPSRAALELESLFGRLGADPSGGVCVEVGCGPGRMTGELARRFDRVIAADVSPAMVERARENVTLENVEFRAVSGERLDGIEDGVADVLVCYLVLQHLPRRDVVVRYFGEFARVLRPASGEAFVQLPVLGAGLAPRLWRTVRSLTVPLVARLSREPSRDPAFRGFRLTERELRRAVEVVGLRVVARDEGPDAPYRYSTDVFLRLARR